jgi:hypothetical protein
MTQPESDALISPRDIQRIIVEKEQAQAREEMAQRKVRQEEQEHLHAAFLDREISPDVRRRFSHAVRRAVERGEKEVMVLRFPSDWCNDGGRSINNAEPEWPATLDGYAKRAYDFFVTELEPLGYRMHALILSFPGGMPGDVGIFVRW